MNSWDNRILLAYLLQFHLAQFKRKLIYIYILIYLVLETVSDLYTSSQIGTKVFYEIFIIKDERK